MFETCQGLGLCSSQCGGFVTRRAAERGKSVWIVDQEIYPGGGDCTDGDYSGIASKCDAREC